MKNKKKALVTGGAGFIGSHLSIKLVNLGYEVTIIDNLSTGRLENIKEILDQIKFIKADISKKNQWYKEIKKIDYVFHLAALADIVPSIENPEKYFDSNVKGTLNILELSKKLKIKKLIYAASSSCYGIPKKFPTNETESISPMYPYALTKYLGETLIMHWAKVYKLPSISLRLFNVYGTKSRTSGTYGAMFGVFLAQKLSKKPLTVVGDGNQKRDFIYVSDVVEAFIKSAKSKLNNEIFNVGADNPISVNEIVKLLKCEYLNIPKRPGEPDCTWANIEKIKLMLNWEPKISIKNGINILEKNIDYWKKAPVWNKHAINKATKTWFKYLK